MANTNYFLIIFDTAAERLADILEFGKDFEQANMIYAKWEAEARRKDRHLEVVLLGAESLDVIKRTHSNYFDEEDPSQSTIEQFKRLLQSIN